MRGINQVCLSGNVTRDPELRATGNGTSVVNFSIAVNESMKSGDQWVEKPSYFDCVAFGKTADHLAQAMGKGFHAVVTGKLRQRTWEKDGQKRSTVEVVCDLVEYRQPKGPRQDGRDYYVDPANAAPAGQAMYDDEIPF